MPKINRIVPLGENVVLEAIKEDATKTKSGIILPDNKDKKPPVLAMIVAVGPKVEVLEEGDTVIFSEYNFDPIKFEERDLLVGPAEKVLAIIKK